MADAPKFQGLWKCVSEGQEMLYDFKNGSDLMIHTLLGEMFTHYECNDSVKPHQMSIIFESPDRKVVLHSYYEYDEAKDVLTLYTPQPADVQANTRPPIDKCDKLVCSRQAPPPPLADEILAMSDEEKCFRIFQENLEFVYERLARVKAAASPKSENEALQMALSDPASCKHMMSIPAKYGLTYQKVEVLKQRNRKIFDKSEENEGLIKAACTACVVGGPLPTIKKAQAPAVAAAGKGKAKAKAKAAKREEAAEPKKTTKSKEERAKLKQLKKERDAAYTKRMWIAGGVAAAGALAVAGWAFFSGSDSKADGPKK